MITGTKTLRVVSSLPLNASVIKKEEIERENKDRGTGKERGEKEETEREEEKIER